MTRHELLGRMSSQELTDWMVYAQVEPFGDERADLRAALVASVIANVNRDPKKKPKPFDIADFMLFRDKAEATREDVEQQIASLFGAPTD